MPAWRNKKSSKQNFLKRRSFEEGQALIDAAQVATYRLYADAFRHWRRCAEPPCKRHRRCLGEPGRCFTYAIYYAAPSRRLLARRMVIAGGPRRVAPASHIEWQIRRTVFQTVLSWALDATNGRA
jgi:hypothetical protein